MSEKNVDDEEYYANLRAGITDYKKLNEIFNKMSKLKKMSEKAKEAKEDE